MADAGDGADPIEMRPTAEMSEGNGALDSAVATNKLTIVGIGASAGGLTPLRTFFATLPADTGMTFVVIVHLAPDHESLLADLLQEHTLMPVTQVQAKVEMEPNHVYVIPPGKRLLVSEGHLDLGELDMPRGRRLQIDTFFRSLAEHHGDGAALIFSGTGSDGAVGIHAIKEKGGLLLVQSPEEAEYDGMPRSAIATGLVDIIAPVAELATQLVAAKHTKSTLQVPDDPTALSSAAQQTLAQILMHLRVRTGHDFSSYKEATILRRLARRMQLAHSATLTTYLNRLRHDGDEADALYRDLLIHVTEFFRDQEAWAILAREIIPKLFADKENGEGVRIWTVGCATGEEAYGIAMLLLEYASTLENPPPLQIFASDLGAMVLDFARKGIYPEAIAADVSDERLARFFIHDNSHYQVRPEVRDLVLFTPHNLLQDPPFSKLDLILCRNVLIYLQRPVQERVFESFHYALRPSGYLFLGSAESAEGITELFETVHKRHRLYRRNPQNNRLVLPTLPLLPRSIHSPAVLETEEQRAVSAGEQHRHLLEEMSLPSLVVNEQFRLLHLSETVGRFLQLPAGTPTDDLLRLVRPELQIELRLALHRAFSQQGDVQTQPVLVQFNGAPHPVTILVRPSPKRGRALVLFWENKEPEPGLIRTKPTDEPDSREAHFESQLQHSHQQLQSTKEEYETAVEELRAANEELQSTNEEYRSTLEELETSKEELQSINEELQSVNQEMKVRMEEIAQANSDLQNLFAATEIATLFLDRELCVKRYTPRAAELFNLMSPDRGRPISHLRSKLNYPALEADVRRVLSNLAPLEREIEAEDGRWFMVGVRPYRTIEDKIDGVVITCVDISVNKANEFALRKANEQLRKAHNLFASLFHSSPIPTCLTRLQDGLLLDANNAYLRFFGLSREAAVGKLTEQFGQWLPADERAKLIEQVQREGQVQSVAMATTHPPGNTKMALVSIERVEIEGVEAAISAFVDITELTQAEANLRRADKRLQLMLESVTDYAFITLDPAGRIVDWWGGAEQMFGYKADEVVGQLGAIIFTPEDRAQGIPEAEIEQVRTTGRAADERWHLRKDGARFFMSGVMVPLVDGAITGYVKIARDLTDRRQMEEALEEEVRVRTEQVRNLVIELTLSEQGERRRISAILHDDLQQRLYSINIQLSMLRQLMASDDVADVPQVIADIEEALRDTVQVTRSLSVNLSPPILHNEGLFEALRWLASHMAQQQGLDVEVVVENALPPLDEDLRVLLFQIVRELLFNVVKHAGVETATVALAFQKKQLRIQVRDGGKGFDVNAQTEETGQGLSRIKQRLNLIGGEIEITSAPGKGTDVVLHVPLRGKNGG